MPIRTCKLPNGDDGFQWGDHGKCYADRKDAERQAEAAHANGFVGDSMKFYTESQLGKTRHLTPEGFLVVESVPIARIGSMDYAAIEVPGIESLGGIVKMSRTADELFSAETIASFEGKPIIIPTGDIHVNGVDADTWNEHAVGHMQGVRRGIGAQSDYLVADLIINDSAAIERVNNGLRELSCGYEYFVRQVSQGFGEQYEIRGNHVALVDRARGGSNLKIGDTEKKMKIKNPLLRLFAHAVKAGDEEAQKDIEDQIEDKGEVSGSAADDEDPSAARIEALEAKLDKLIDVVSALTATKAADTNDSDEDDTMTAGDAEWQEVISGAAIIAPDLVIDKKAKIGDEMSRIIEKAAGDHIKRMIGDAIPSKMNAETLGITFRSIVETQKALNNSKHIAADSFGSDELLFGHHDNGGFTFAGR